MCVIVFIYFIREYVLLLYILLMLQRIFQLFCYMKHSETRKRARRWVVGKKREKLRIWIGVCFGVCKPLENSVDKIDLECQSQHFSNCLLFLLIFFILGAHSLAFSHWLVFYCCTKYTAKRTEKCTFTILIIIYIHYVVCTKKYKRFHLLLH